MLLLLVRFVPGNGNKVLYTISLRLSIGNKPRNIIGLFVLYDSDVSLVCVCNTEGGQ